MVAGRRGRLPACKRGYGILNGNYCAPTIIQTFKGVRAPSCSLRLNFDINFAGAQPLVGRATVAQRERSEISASVYSPRLWSTGWLWPDS